ncbi:MAG: bacterioferritin-associated ferredoxin [Pseudomonas sp.]
MAARIINRETFDLNCGGGFCPCYRLAQGDFCRAIEAGATTVKAVYQEQGVKAKCGDCVRRVKTLLEQHPTN